MPEDHGAAVLVMILDYRENGENNRKLMAICERIVERCLVQAEMTETKEDETDS